MKTDETSPFTVLLWFLMMSTWVALGVHRFRAERMETAEVKRRKALPRSVVAGGIFVVFCILATRDWRAVWVVLPVSLILWLTNRYTVYCDKCQRTSYNRNWFVTMSACPKCGAEIKHIPGSKAWVED
jgi:hypothetical protein